MSDEMRDRIEGILFTEDGEAALAILREILDGYELEPIEFEKAESPFEGAYIKSDRDGFCKDCAEPYEEKDLIWWCGPGKGAYCEGCKKAEEYENGKKTRAKVRGEAAR